MRQGFAVSAIAMLFGAGALAGEADVIDAKARRVTAGYYDFEVTIRSNDRGAGYFADAFDILAPDGTLLGRRELTMRQNNEQPFTRDLRGVKVPLGVDRVVIRARHNARGFDGVTFTLALPR